uniref:LptF/LptG family permease n=1 Tax=Candidatus Pelagibacter sp. HIMB1746 TaxID=3413370 RepID=UPI003F847C67
MKKILFRKILFDCLTFFLISLISISTIIWIFQAVNFLDIMIEDGRDYQVYFSYSLLNFPKIISKIIPFSIFFSFFYIISKYEIQNELMIFWNFGVSKFQLINFFLKISFAILLFQIILTTFIIPYTQDLARSYLRNSNFNFFENFIKPKKFNDNIKGLTIFNEKKDKDGVYYNLYLKKKTNTGYQVTYAKKGEFIKIGNIPILRLVNGETITETNGKITNISFSMSDINLSDTKSNTTTYIKTQELSSIKLIKCINLLYGLELFNFSKTKTKIENCTIQNSRNIVKELYKRLIIPFYIPSLILTALLLIIKSKENINFNRQRIFIFVIGLIILIGSESTLRLIDNKLF